MSREYRLALEIPTGPAYDPEAEPGKLQPLKYRHPFYSSKGKAWYGDVEAVPAVDWRAPALKPANQWGEATFCAFETGMFMIEPRNLIGFR